MTLWLFTPIHLDMATELGGHLLPPQPPTILSSISYKVLLSISVPVWYPVLIITRLFLTTYICKTFVYKNHQEKNLKL